MYVSQFPFLSVPHPGPRRSRNYRSRRRSGAAFSSTAPAVGPNDIANLAGAAVVGNNVASGDPNAPYFADDRPIRGQTFTTGSNPAGYQRAAVTVRQVIYDTYALVPDVTYTIRINSLPASPPARFSWSAGICTSTSPPGGCGE